MRRQQPFDFLFIRNLVKTQMDFPFIWDYFENFGFYNKDRYIKIVVEHRNVHRCMVQYSKVGDFCLNGKGLALPKCGCPLKMRKWKMRCIRS